MNDYERPTVSVRQRIAAINRTIQEEQRKAQNAAGRGAVRIPWRPQTKGSSARSNSINLVQLPQRLARTGTNKSPSLAPIARPPLDRKREAADTARDSLPDKSIRLNGSSTRGRTQTTVDTLREIHTPSNIPRECRPSSRVSDIHREPRHSRLSQISTSSTSSYPPSHLNSDEMYQIYTRYLQCQLCAVRIHETSEKNKQAKQDQLWNMYSELREFKRTADPKSVQELTQLLNEYSVVSKQLQDAAEDLDTKISSDLMAGLVRDLYEILTAVRNTLISNDSMKDVFSIDAEIQMLKECTRLTDAVALAEAEHQSLSAIV